MVKNVALALFCAILGGCATTVYPTARPVDPTAVYVADYGVHSGLLLPTDDGRYVEYAFGDWNFAALNHTWPHDAVAALLISFQSTLGRRFVDIPPGHSQPRPLHPAPHSMQLVYVSRAAAARVVRELDERYRHSGGLVMHNPDNGMDYVKDDEHYWMANNCNHLTARCLREMGCDVRGFVMFSTFAVASPPPTGVPPTSPPDLPAVAIPQVAGTSTDRPLLRSAQAN